MSLPVVGLAALALLRAFAEAIRDPIVHRATIPVANWPVDRPPLRLLLIGDIHVASPICRRRRVAWLVEQINQTSPDVDLIARDFISDKRIADRLYSVDEAIAPLAGLNATLGQIRRARQP